MTALTNQALRARLPLSRNAGEGAERSAAGEGVRPPSIRTLRNG
jgi:hypothetical protein